MLIACWSVKGGSGATVVAAALAVVSASSAPDGVVLADLVGDVPAALGLAEPTGPGVAAWLAAPDDVGVDALDRLEIEATPKLALLAAGHAASDPRPGRGLLLAEALALDGRLAIVDAGTAPAGPALEVVASASVSLLVVRPCYLALRRAVAFPVRPSAVVLVREPGRSLGRRDVEQALDVPVRAEIDLEPAVARAVDAGLLASRLPRSLAQALRRAA